MATTATRRQPNSSAAERCATPTTRGSGRASRGVAVAALRVMADRSRRVKRDLSEVRRKLKEIRTQDAPGGDFEVVHALEDKLHAEFIAWVAEKPNDYVEGIHEIAVLLHQNAQRKKRRFYA